MSKRLSQASEMVGFPLRCGPARGASLAFKIQFCQVSGQLRFVAFRPVFETQ